MNTTSAFEPLTIMLSSRCSDQVPFGNGTVSMAEVRKAIKNKLEDLQLFGMQVFKVWIHENEAVESGDKKAWDLCIKSAKQADIFLMLYNGNAGWPGTLEQYPDQLGICHAELAAAYGKAASKVRSIQFPVRCEDNEPNQRFRDYVGRQQILGPQVQTGEEAIEKAGEIAVAALLFLARAGVGVSSAGSFYTGEALEWTRLDFQGRRKVTTEAVATFLGDRHGVKPTQGRPTTVVVPLAGGQVAFVCDCIPSALTTAAARELVGQPFLRDHVLCAALPVGVGPVHLIACQKGVTETQALRQLGFPDAIAVTAPFGVYVADPVQKIQMVFIANCRDETTTLGQLQRFLQWLEQEGEDRRLAGRASARRRIADLIAKEQQG